VPEPTRRSEPTWFEPYPDALLDTTLGPEARYETREALALAFVSGLQRLPPRQRAVLVLRDVLGFRAAEVADLLDSTGVSVNSALQRAGAYLEGQVPARDRDRAPLPRSPRERELVVGRFVEAMGSCDVGRLVALLTDDAWLTMPPEPLEYQEHAAIPGSTGPAAGRTVRPSGWCPHGRTVSRRLAVTCAIPTARSRTRTDWWCSPWRTTGSARS
jgi:hypothetical protein